MLNVKVTIKKQLEIPIYKWLSKIKELHMNNFGAFVWSASNGYIDNIKFFITDCGVDINLEEGIALILAAKHNHLEVVNFLLKNGADKNLIPTKIVKLLDKDMLNLLQLEINEII